MKNKKIIKLIKRLRHFDRLASNGEMTFHKQAQQRKVEHKLHIAGVLVEHEFVTDAPLEIMQAIDLHYG